MKKIIDPVDKQLLKSELTEERFLRDTNRAGNKIYIVDYQNAPNVMREIGRLREIAFRDGGGGTGEELDIDKFDTDPAYGYKQLIVWDPDEECIIGGYRYVLCDEAVFDYYGQPILTSSHLFKYTRKFIKNYLRQTIELGRSFVSLDYQGTKPGSKSIYALDNLFDGLGALTVLYHDRMKYFIGKMSIYQNFPKEGLGLLLCFLKKHFSLKEDKLVVPWKPYNLGNTSRFKSILSGSNYDEDYKILKAEVRKLGVNIPPLVNAYMNLSATMKIFGTAINDEFGDVLDTGLMIAFDEINPEKVKRHIHLPEFNLKKILSMLDPRKK